MYINLLTSINLQNTQYMFLQRKQKLDWYKDQKTYNIKDGTEKILMT